MTVINGLSRHWPNPDAKVEVLYRGLWKPNGDEETEMQKQQKKRSLLMRQGQ